MIRSARGEVLRHGHRRPDRCPEFPPLPARRARPAARRAVPALAAGRHHRRRDRDHRRAVPRAL